MEVSVGFVLFLAAFSSSSQDPVTPGLGQKCFHKLGCFRTIPDSEYPPPYAPETFTSYVIVNTGVDETEEVTVYPEISSRLKELLNPQAKTFVLAHGYIDSGKMPSWQKMGNNIRRSVPEANIIILDWEKGAFTDYLTATSNVRVVAAVLANIIRFLVEELGFNPDDFHLIGHSLGAHIVGFACKNLANKVGWITALDPAGPGYDNKPRGERLDSEDATYTEGLQTNGGTGLRINAETSFGTRFKWTCVLFIMDGGHLQKSCLTLPSQLENPKHNIAATPSGCSHLIAADYYSSAIANPNCLTGHRQSGGSMEDETPNGKLSIGLESRNNWKGNCESYAVQTSVGPPYCSKDRKRNFFSPFA